MVGINIKANSVQFQLKLPTGTELGKNVFKLLIWNPEIICKGEVFLGGQSGLVV